MQTGDFIIIGTLTLTLKNTKQQVYSLKCKVQLSQQSLGMGMMLIFTTIASLAFAVLATTDISYPTGTPILVCTLATRAGIWQTFNLEITISGTNKQPFLIKP
jgi:hypothetical protein